VNLRSALVLAGLVTTGLGCVTATNVEFSRATGPGVKLVRPARLRLHPPGPLTWSFASRIETGSVQIAVAPQNDYPRLSLVGIVLPVVPYWAAILARPVPGERFWIALRVDAGDLGYGFDPGRVALQIEGGTPLRPEEFYVNDCEFFHGAAIPSKPDGPISLNAAACFNLAYDVSVPRPSTSPFTLRIDGLTVGGAAAEVPPIPFSAHTGWTVHFEGVS
jgi:hypothetical protein